MYDLPKCSVCGGHPTVTKHISSTCQDEECIIGCHTCNRWSGPFLTMNCAIKNWEEMNPPNKWLNIQIEKCSKCGTQPNVHWHKSINSYAIKCNMCGKSIEKKELKDAIYEWNLRPISWSHEKSKIIAKKTPPPRERYLFYEDRIRALSSAISERLDWMGKVEQCGMYPMVIDWSAIEDWAKELADTCKLRKDIS